MAGVKISDLAAVVTPATTAPFPVVDGGVTKQLTLANAGATIITGAASEIIDSNLTADRVLQSSGTGKIEASAITAAELASFVDLASGPVANLLANGNFVLFDLGAAPTAVDNAYFANGWRYLSDATSGQAAGQQSASPPVGSRYFSRLAGAVVGTSVFGGQFYVLRADDSIPLRGKTVSLSFQAQRAGGAVRAAVLAWTGTADALTADPVSAWAATPTMIAGYTLENTPADLGVGAAWDRYIVENILLDTAGLNNVAVFIWVNATAGSGATFQLDISQVQLQLGPATAFVNRPAQTERALASRNDYTFTGAPAVTDDITKGFGLGSKVINITADDDYVCLDAAAGAAVWKKTTP